MRRHRQRWAHCPRRPWTFADDDTLDACIQFYGLHYKPIADVMTRSPDAIRNRLLRRGVLDMLQEEDHAGAWLDELASLLHPTPPLD